jgi:hypothetical protein
MEAALSVKTLEDASARYGTPDRACFNPPPIRMVARIRQTLHLSMRNIRSDNRDRLSFEKVDTLENSIKLQPQVADCSCAPVPNRMTVGQSRINIIFLI